MEKETDKKIIKLNPFRSNIHNSPLLQGKEVEVKQYTDDLNAFRKTNETGPVEQPVAENQPTVEQPPIPEPEKETWGDQYSYNAPQDPPPPSQYSEDNVEEATFDDKPEEPEPDKSDLMSPTQAKGQAAMMIRMYSAFVPPNMAKMLAKDVGRVKAVMSHNNVPITEIRKIEQFLNTKNVQIEKALQLDPEQVILLKDALSAVLERYKLSSDNPLVNLGVVMLSIAVTQYFAVTAIIKAQHEQIMELIDARGLTAPAGYEDFAQPQGLFKKKIKIKTAA